MTNKVNSPSTTEGAHKAELPRHWLHAVKRYGWYLWSVGLCGLGAGIEWVALPELVDLSFFGVLVGLVGLLLWLLGTVFQVVHELKRYKAETGYFYDLPYDVILVAALSVYTTYCCLFLTEPSTFETFARGDFSLLQDWVIALAFFLAACVCGAYFRTHKSQEHVASEEEYQRYKRLYLREHGKLPEWPAKEEDKKERV